MTIVASVGPLRRVQDIEVASKSGRSFTVDIYEFGSGGQFESEVIVRDAISNPATALSYRTKPASASAADNFRASIELIVSYLKVVDAKDSVDAVHNPCNDPFVKKDAQDQILTSLGVHVSATVN